MHKVTRWQTSRKEVTLSLVLSIGPLEAWTLTISAHQSERWYPDWSPSRYGICFIYLNIIVRGLEKWLSSCPHSCSSCLPEDPQGCSKPDLIIVPEGLMPSSGLYGHSTHVVHRYKQAKYPMCNIKIKFKKKTLKYTCLPVIHVHWDPCTLRCV